MHTIGPWGRALPRTLGIAGALVHQAVPLPLRLMMQIISISSFSFECCVNMPMKLSPIIFYTFTRANYLSLYSSSY